MSNQRRQFLRLAAGAIAVPAASSLVVAQGDPSRGREAPIPAQASVPERRPAKSELTGLSALLTPEVCVVLLIDHQSFQFANLHSHEPAMIMNNVIGLAKFAKAFNVPVILTTVLEARGGKIIKGLLDVFPGQKPIDRTYINARQDKRIVDLMKGTGRKKLVMAALGPRCAWRCPLFTPSAKATMCTSSPLQVAFLRKLMTWRFGEWCKQGPFRSRGSA
jgi:hypothetical protein